MKIQLSLRGIALRGLCLDFFGVISCSIEAKLFKATNQQVSRITPMNTKGPQTNAQNLKGKQKTQAFKRKTSKFLTQTWNNFAQCNVHYSTWKRYLMKALIQTKKEILTVGAERFSRLRIKINIHEMVLLSASSTFHYREWYSETFTAKMRRCLHLFQWSSRSLRPPKKDNMSLLAYINS